MAESSMVKKLGMKPGQRILTLNPPAGYIAQLGELPAGTTLTDQPGGEFDAVQLFVASKAELERAVAGAIAAVRQGGMLWIAYPKKSSRQHSDLSRNILWQTLLESGWQGVFLIAIDDTWSAMRFRPDAEVKSGRLCPSPTSPLTCSFLAPDLTLGRLSDTLLQRSGLRLFPTMSQKKSE